MSVADNILPGQSGQLLNGLFLVSSKQKEAVKGMVKACPFV